MAPRNAERQGFVKTLRQLGRTCGVRAVPSDNNVGQARVRELLTGILSSPGLTQEQRVQAMAAHDGYAATFEVGMGRAVVPTEGGGRRACRRGGCVRLAVQSCAADIQPHRRGVGVRKHLCPREPVGSFQGLWSRLGR